MIGDRYHDVDAALAVGARAVGVSWGYGSANEMKAAHAVANHPEALVEAISAPA
jgi:phosphoglycolate phosphatase